MQELKNKEEELEIAIQKKLSEERVTLSEQIRKQEMEKNVVKETEHNLKLRELEKQLADQKNLTEEIHIDTTINGNNPPDYSGVSDDKIVAYINKLYIDLLGRAPTLRVCCIRGLSVISSNAAKPDQPFL